MPNKNRQSKHKIKFKLNVYDIIVAPITVQITSTIARFKNLYECTPSLGLPNILENLAKGQLIYIIINIIFSKTYIKNDIIYKFF